MKTIIFDAFSREPKLIRESGDVLPGEFAVGAPDSFRLAKTIQENVLAQKKNAAGEGLYEAYKDADDNYYPEAGSGLTQVEVTEGDIGDVTGFHPVLVEELQDVLIASEKRIRDFTALEVYQGIGEAFLGDNPTYDYVISGSLGSAFDVWDTPNCDNLIMGDFQVAMFPGTSAQTSAITLAVSTSEMLGEFDVDSDIAIEVSVDGGATFTSLVDGVPATLPAAGNSLVVRFTNNHTTERRGIRGFNLLYR